MITANEIRENIAIAAIKEEEERLIQDIKLYNEIVKDTIDFCETTINRYLKETTKMPIVLPFEIMKSQYVLHTRYNHNYFYRVSWTHYKTKHGEKRDVDHMSGKYFDYLTMVSYLDKYGFSVTLQNCNKDFNRSCGYSNVYRICINFNE
jgi:coenzyme F420-reducing hydrogenase alpha subunit